MTTTGDAARRLVHGPAAPAGPEGLALFARGADPWITHHAGLYWYTHTTGRDVTLRCAPTVEGLRRAEPFVAWTPPKRGPCSRHLWAPELHRVGDRWYVYVAADDGRNENHRMWVLEGKGDDPRAGFAPKGKITTPDDSWAIDGTPFDGPDGRRYFVWSGWEGRRDGEQALYVARMWNPWSLAGERVRVCRVSLPWEWESRRGVRVVEGPQVLRRDGRLFVVYSADQSWTDAYKLGLLEIRGCPLDPASWHKRPRPVFRSTPAGAHGPGVHAPGHASFLADAPDGRHWMLYHCARRAGAGWDREVRAQTFTWDAEGAPEFGEPFPRQSALAVARTRTTPPSSSR